MILISFKKDFIVLDATVFIRTDFPRLIEKYRTSNTFFKTTSGVLFELKDFKSRMNLDLLKESGALIIENPEPSMLKKIKEQITMIDPSTSLSQVDIEVLALASQSTSPLMSNDLEIQNIAIHLKIPLELLGGKKISYKEIWKLKCRSCGRISEIKGQKCPYCSGNLKKIRIQKEKLNSV